MTNGHTDELQSSLRVALLRHEDAVAQLARVSRRLEAALPVPRDEAERVLREAIEGGRSVRDLLTSARTLIGDAAPAECDGADGEAPLAALKYVVNATADKLDELSAAVPVRRLTALIAELRGGRVIRSTRPAVAEQRRHDALEELEAGLAASVRRFPGPGGEGESWLGWFWSLENLVLQVLVTELEGDWPRLLDFVEFVRPGDWMSKESSNELGLSGAASVPALDLPSTGQGEPPRLPGIVHPEDPTKPTDAAIALQTHEAAGLREGRRQGAGERGRGGHYAR